MDITFQVDESFRTDINTQQIQTAIVATLTLFNNQDLPAESMAVTITNNQTMTQLNHHYRGLNAPTDVLSFENLSDPDFPEVDPAMSHHLGDIIIAQPVAQTQAKAGGHTVLEEIILLSVHGSLHLLGFNHDTPEQKAEMWAAQSQVMTKLKLAHVQATEG